MDELGPIDIEFLINNPELAEQSKQAQATLTSAIQRMEADLAALKKAAQDALTLDPLAANNYVSQIERVEAALVTKRRQLETLITSSSAKPLADGLKEVEQSGVQAFDNVGKSAVKSTNYFTTAWSWLRKIAYALPGIGVAGIIGFAVGPIIEYFSWLSKVSDGFDAFQKRLQFNNEGLLSDDFKKAISAVSELTEHIQLAKKGYLDKTEVLTEYNKELGKSLGYTNDLNTAEQLIIEKGQAYIKLTLLKATAQAALNEATAKQLEYEKAAQSNTNPEDAQNDKKDISGFKNLTVWERLVSAFSQSDATTRKLLEDGKARALKTAGDERDGLLKIYDDIEKQAAELAKKNHIDFFGGKEDQKGEENALNALLQTEISLREKIAEFTNRQNQKSLSPDQQALTTISDQFAAITFQINQANAKYDAFVKKFGQAAVDKFNANPDNKVKLSKTDPTTLVAAQNAAIDNQADLNENTYIQQDIDKKKKLYADYYAYRLKVGEDQANKEYADLLESGKDFATYLSNIQNSIPAGDQSGALQKRRDLVAKAQQQDAEDRQKAFVQLLESVKTYETERLTLTATYRDKRQQLIAAGKVAEAAVLDEQYKEQLGKLDDANFEKLQSVKELYSGITRLSKDSAQRLINDVQAELNARIAAGQITEAEAKKVQETIDKAQKSLNVRTPDALINIGRYIGEMGQALQGVNGTLATFVTDSGAAISQIGKITKAFQESQKTTADYADLAIAGLTAVFNIIGSITSASAARKQAEQDYYNSVIEFQNQYNIALDEEQRLKSQTDGNIFLTNYSKQIEDAVKSYKSASEQYQQSLKDLEAGQAKVGKKNAVDGSKVLSGAENGAVAGAVVGSVVPVVGTVAGAIGGAIIGGLSGLFGGKKKVDVFAPLLQTYPQLIDESGKFNESLAKTLIATNQVSEQTKTLLQNTINYYDEEQASIDQINSALSNLANNLGSNLESALVQAFETGGDAAKAFGSTVSDVIGNIVQQFLFEDIFSSEFDKLNKKLKDTVLAGGSSADITKDFVDFFKEAAPLATQFTDSLKAAKDAAAAQGIDLFNNPSAASTPTTITGSIKGITENQANVLEGALRGTQLAVVHTNEILEITTETQQQQLSEMKNQTLLQMQIAANTKRTADNTDILPAMNDNLKSINKNTSDTAGNVLRAAGITN